MLFVKLEDLRHCRACVSGYNKLARSLLGRCKWEHERDWDYIGYKHPSPIEIEYILNSNGLDDALWSLIAVDDQRGDVLMFQAWMARSVQHLLDPEIWDAITLLEKYALREASLEEFAVARKKVVDAENQTLSYMNNWISPEGWAISCVSSAFQRTKRPRVFDVACNMRDALGSPLAQDAQRDMLLKMLHGEAPWQIAQR